MVTAVVTERTGDVGFPALTASYWAIGLAEESARLARFVELGERRLDVAEFVMAARAKGTDPHTIIRSAENHKC